MADKSKRGTFIHGIAASEHIDSSGERIKIEGVDITSLTKDGTFNYEHDSKSPSSIVGKIWEAKKILKRADCESEHQKYFWDKIKMPFIYVAGELFDSVGHNQAGEVAAMLRYDQLDAMNKDAKRLINFSIEGSRVEKSGQIITKCIARKVSVTLTPCNKVCEAEELKIDDGAKKESDSGSFAFVQDIMSKSDEPSCQIMKGEIPFLYKNEEVKMTPKQAVKEHKRLVTVLESPSHKDDKEEAKKQRKELKEYKEKLGKGEKKINPKDPVLNYDKIAPKAPSEAKQKQFASRVTRLQGVKKRLSKYDSNVRKALTASCGMGAPSTKVQGDALQKEDLKGVHNTGIGTGTHSRAGVMTIAGSNKKTPRKPGGKERQAGAARQMHARKLQELRNMPKPNLPKSEFLYKNEEIPAAPKKSNGSRIGQTKSGKDVFSHGMVGEYQGFSSADHAEAADFHRQMVLKSPSFKDKEMHMGKMRLHNQAFSSNINKELAKPQQQAIPAATPGKKYSKMSQSYAVPNPGSEAGDRGKGVMGYSQQASAYGNPPAPAAPAAPMAPPAPAAPTNPVQAAKAMNPNMKMAKSEVFIIRKLSEPDVNKGSKNVREQRKKVFGTNSQPGANSAMREKHIAHIKQFVDKHLGLDLQPSGGKVNAATGERRKADNAIGEDKPDWRSGKFEAQWNPEAIVHEIAHLMLLPKGVGLEEGQTLMDKQYSDVQKQYGYMQQKRSQGEVQPMAAEQLIRRAMGLPSSKVSIPVKSKDDPHRVSVEDPNVRIATRVQSGKQKDGTPKYVDLIRQARNLHPEHKQRLMDIFSGKLKFHPDKGWQPNKTSLDAAITNRAPGAVMARQNKKQMAAPQPTELPPNVVRMKQPKPAAPAAPAPAPAQPSISAQAPQEAPQEAPQMPPMKIAKSEQRQVMKMLGDRAFEQFEKKEELLAFLAEKLPKLSDRERLAIAKAVAYTNEKKKEAALASLMDEE